MIYEQTPSGTTEMDLLLINAYVILDEIEFSAEIENDVRTSSGNLPLSFLNSTVITFFVHIFLNAPYVVLFERF